MYTDWSEPVKWLLAHSDACMEINNSTAKYTLDCPSNTGKDVDDKRLQVFQRQL